MHARRLQLLLVLLLCLLAASCAENRLGPEADKALKEYKEQLKADPGHRVRCTVDDVSLTLPQGWFEMPLQPGASPFIKHFYIHGERTAKSGMLPVIRVFEYPPDTAPLLFTSAESFDAFANENIPGYTSASLEFDGENRIIRQVYRCLAPEMGGMPVFRCATILASANGVVEVQYTDALDNLPNAKDYYFDVEELMTSITRP